LGHHTTEKKDLGDLGKVCSDKGGSVLQEGACWFERQEVEWVLKQEDEGEWLSQIPEDLAEGL
jgi:hypothetical protein